MSKLTPAQQQYSDFKQHYPDCLLLFRLGDFYELFHEDAQIAHQVLGITLTARDKGSENPIPMAGIPYHALDKYLPKLIESGYKVAIADQIGEVVPGKLVDRQVTQVITPGVWVEPGSPTCYIAAVGMFGKERCVLWGDLSLGTRTIQTFATEIYTKEALQNIGIRELVVLRSTPQAENRKRRAEDDLRVVCSLVGEVPDPEQRLIHTLHIPSLQVFGDTLSDSEMRLCAGLFHYIQSHQQLLYVRRISSGIQNDDVAFDALTIKNLEIFQGSYYADKEHSLYGILDTCRTSMGSRLLADRLAHPARDISVLNLRQEAIQYRYDHMDAAKAISSSFSLLPDLPRILQKIRSKTNTILLLGLLKEQFTRFLAIPEVQQHVLAQIDSELLDQIQKSIVLLQDVIADEYKNTICWIRPGYNEQIDELRTRAGDIDTVLLGYQQRISTHTGVPVKIKYVTNQGYSLEVTPKDIVRFESYIDPNNEDMALIRSQTLKTGQRYTSGLLHSIQQRIDDAKQQLEDAQINIGQQLLAERNIYDEAWQRRSDRLAYIDLTLHSAQYAYQHNRSKPVLHNGYELEITQGRHPVVEHFLSATQMFIANDTSLQESNFFHLITGPNMGGKSTYLRQVAIITLLAHTGLRVPAKQAKISLVDGIYARIGSGDSIAQQQSTFMTEMLETATILRQATKKSLIVFDELGRGTSTYDGLALAKAISVYICRDIKTKTLFATHYHELISLAEQVEGFANRHATVDETSTEVIFLKKIRPGGADKSYGIDVAKMAGIPEEVVGLAKQYLDHLHQVGSQKKPHQQGFVFAPDGQDEKILATLRKEYADLDVTKITPLQALQLLEGIVQKIRGIKEKKS